uniref:PH01B019A14.21 protein n=1 Tax=Phyllostachys edulis TaxID=38705 RepID=L0P2G9_PHYED|nr:PH01B019A14.21 [Phyllostachys edulis]
MESTVLLFLLVCLILEVPRLLEEGSSVVKRNMDSKEQRYIYGIKDNLMRFSIGVEDFEDLKNDVFGSLREL